MSVDKLLLLICTAALKYNPFRTILKISQDLILPEQGTTREKCMFYVVPILLFR